MKQLPVLGTVADAYAFVRENWRDFLLLASLPVAIGAIAETLLPTFFVPGAEIPVDSDVAGGVRPNLVAAVGALVALVLYVMFAVAWHRRFLSLEQTTVGAALRWGPRQMRFLARFVTLALVMIAAGLLFGGSLTVGAVAATGSGTGPLRLIALFGVLVGVVLMYSRLLLIFPAAALDEKMSLVDSWRLTRGNSWRMVGISFLPFFPIWIASAFVSVPILAAISAFGLRESLTVTLATNLVEQAFVFAGVAVTVSALSIAYRDFKATGSSATALTSTPSE